MRIGRTELACQGAADDTRSDTPDSGGAPQVPDGREENQGRDLAVHDLEGRLHMLDYDKKFSSRVGQHDLRRLFDSRLRGAERERFAAGNRLSAFYWGRPTFSRGKVMVFGRSSARMEALSRGLRAVLKLMPTSLQQGCYTLNAADEIEGFVFKGSTPSGATTKRANSSTSVMAATITHCGRYAPPVYRRGRRSATAMASRTRRTTRRSLPRSSRSTTATGGVAAADQIQIYKLICRQIATKMG